MASEEKGADERRNVSVKVVKYSCKAENSDYEIDSSASLGDFQNVPLCRWIFPFFDWYRMHCERYNYISPNRKRNLICDSRKYVGLI